VEADTAVEDVCCLNCDALDTNDIHDASAMSKKETNQSASNNHSRHRADRWLNLLSWFCPPALYEGIEGDLLEQYEEDLNTIGKKKAKQRLIKNIFKFFRPGIIFRNKFSFQHNNTIMIGNYFKVAMRNIQKRKLYSFINAFGLSIGIAFCTLIYLYIQDERSFDQFHVNKDRIYRMETKSYNYWEANPKKPYYYNATVQTGLQPAMKEEIPEVEFASRYSPGRNVTMRKADEVFTEKITYVDADFFNMFSFQVIAGSPDKLFTHKSDMVITPDIAKKYFDNEDPIGKTLVFHDGEEKSFTVTGIIEAPPSNSSISFSILIPQENRGNYENNVTQWGTRDVSTFIQLRAGADLQKFGANLEKMTEKYLGEMLRKQRATSAIPIPEGIKLTEFQYTALTDIHMRKEIGWEKVSDPQYSLILGAIAILILFIACINYVSLALTTSASRKTEVGIRKTVGAQKQQLVYQFGIESVLLALVSMIIGLVLVVLFLPSFNQFTGKTIQVAYTGLLPLLSVSTGITLLAGILAGSYPALFLSSFLPATVLKGKFTSKFQTGFTRPLVVLQFALSAFLMISSVIMYRQMDFITNKDLGFNKEQVLVIPTQTGWNKKADELVERFRTKAQQEPIVEMVSGTSVSIARGFSSRGYKINDENKSSFFYLVDPNYIPALDLKLTLGRNFDATISSDSSGIIVNEALVRDMNWTDPLNEYLNWQEDSLSRGSKVIGVLKDFHFESLAQEIKPMFLSINTKSFGHLSNILVRVSEGNAATSVEKMRSIWNELSPDKPFQYTFLDEDVAHQYESQQRWMRITGFSTGFAIFISCLGLFGLAGINAVNRTKEIGIRKVMGAEMKSIFILMNKQYIGLSLIAFALAVPASWFVMTKWWLSDFKFAIEVGWELFAISMISGLFIALATVSYHSIKAAWINPADTLKYE